MPVVGYGTSKTTDPKADVEMALNTGYRHIDCAHVGFDNVHYFLTLKI